MSYPRLIYVYIEHYQGARDVELCFDDRFFVHYDKDANELIARPNKDHIDGLWGKRICSLATIVGENGSGKSSALRYILNSVSTKFCKEADENIIVLETDKALKAYTTNKSLKAHITKDIECLIEVREFIDRIPTFYYSAHFSLPYHGDPAVIENSEYIYNASEGFRLLQDYQDFCDADLTELKQTLGNHMLGCDAQGKFLISNLLADHYDNMKAFDLNSPRYVLVIPNRSGEYSVISKYFIDDKLPEFPEFDINEKTANGCKAMARFSYDILVSYATNNRDIKTETLDVLKRWTDMLKSKVYSDDNELLEDYQDVSSNEPLTADIVNKAVVLLTAIESSCRFNDQGGTFYFDLTIQSDRKAFKRLMHSSRKYNREFISARFFDLEYTRDLNDRTTLSSGEQEMINLYAALYDASIRRQNDKRKTLPISLIMIDEAEIGYHPEWQRQFVYNLTQFLNSLNVPDKDFLFQVVITTHSPLILSDIPRSCTNYLSRKHETLPTRETFGANIFDLYHNSFFLREGMIGEFAMGKIKDVRDLIKKLKAENKEIMQDDNKAVKVTEEEKNEARRTIRLISDDSLREYMTEELYSADRRGKISRYRDKIAKLLADKP
ncbi:MAG: ATP-binding protein [Clostridia bacterium]|nr:ATP-binding protein [Clostridia bacterium]